MSDFQFCRCLFNQFWFMIQLHHKHLIIFYDSHIVTVWVHNCLWHNSCYWPWLSLSLWHSKYLIKSKSLRSWGRGARSTPTPLNVIVYRLKILHLPLQTHLSNLSVRLGIKTPCFGMSEIPKRQNNTEVSNPHFYSFIPLHSIQVFLSLSLNIVEVLNCSSSSIFYTVMIVCDMPSLHLFTFHPFGIILQEFHLRHLYNTNCIFLH